MVFQRFNLFPHMTALENIIEAPMQVKGVHKAEAKERGDALLERVGLGDKLRQPTRRSCPAASSSGSRSPGPWRWTRS